MPRRSSWLPVAVLIVVAAAVAVQRIGAPIRRAPAAPAGEAGAVRATIAEDRQTMLGHRADGTIACELSLEEWRAWVEEHLEGRLGGPVRIGFQEMPPGAFDGFTAAALAPDGARLAFTVTAYALLTTASIVGLLDTGDASLEVVREVAFGDVAEVLWSPDGHAVAYLLDTGRAQGEGLRVDDVVDLGSVVFLDARALLAAADTAGRDAVDDWRQWLLELRDLAWVDDVRLEFTSNDPETTQAGGATGWTVSLGDGMPVPGPRD